MTTLLVTTKVIVERVRRSVRLCFSANKNQLRLSVQPYQLNDTLAYHFYLSPSRYIHFNRIKELSPETFAHLPTLERL